MSAPSLSNTKHVLNSLPSFLVGIDPPNRTTFFSLAIFRIASKDGDVERGDDDSGAPRDVGDASWRRKYAGAFVALAFATWALRDGRGASSRLGKAFGWACRDALAARSCAHETAVRVGLGNSLFFAFMLVVTFMVKESDRTSARVRFNEGFWLVKGVIWLGLLVAAFAVTLNDYSGLVNVDRFFAAVFLSLIHI